MNAKKKRDELHEEAPAEQQPDGAPYDSHDINARIQQRAYEIWQQRGGGESGADKDWLQAEAEINSALGAPGQEEQADLEEPTRSRRAIAG
jgi:hypothetical protein